MRQAHNKTLVLVDGSSYLFRAYHALPALSNSSGQPTGAIHGVINMLRRLLKDYQPDYFAVIFDAKGKTFRNDMYPKYKANRPPMAQELACQIKPLHEIISAMGLPLMVVDGIEADDVIGTLAHQADQQGLTTVISTGDKDFTQLVNPRISLINTMNGTRLDPAGVEEKFGVPPERIIDYLTLVGDSVDNVPGVPKVGPKTAVKWLVKYGTLEGVVANADQIPGKVGENLRASLDQIPLSQRLVTIVKDAELSRSPTDLIVQPVDNQALIQHYKTLEFKTWLDELLSAEGGAETGNSAEVTDYQTILTQVDLDSWVERLAEAKYFAFDTETTSLNYMRAELVGVSFAVSKGQAAYVPCGHDYEEAPQQLSREQVLATLRPLLEDPQKAKLGHNLKYDMSVLANHGIQLTGIHYDSMLESYVLDSAATRHDMDSLALKYLGVRTVHFEDVAGKGAKQITFNQVPLEQAAPYAAEDADITLRLHQTFWEKLQQTPRLKQVYNDIELPLVPILSRMERKGVMIDGDMLATQSGELAERMAALEQQAFELAGQEFNLGSPKQIQAILYDKLNLPIKAKTPKGQPSTAEAVLQELALDYPLPKLILDHRGLSKLKSTYTDRLPQQINPDTGRVHTSYHQAVAATGRLSSSDPNLQNIPIRTEQGRRIRQAFIAAPGKQLLAADYSQIELRIMAHLSSDTGLLAAFTAGEDIHKATAAEVFGVMLDDVTGDQRRAAKGINFGLIYGMSAFGLAKQLGIQRRAAQTYVDLYFARYPGVKDYMDRTREQAHSQGYVETVFGRRLYLPEINARNAQRRQYAERTAINAPMQGTAADIIKRAMISVDQWLTQSQIDASMIMQVHDELVLEVAEQALDEVEKHVSDIMQRAAQLSVPLLVDIGRGQNWDQAH